MGSHHYSDLVKFVAHNIIKGDYTNLPLNNNGKFMAPHAWFEGEFDGQEHDELIVNGWKYTQQKMSSLTMIGKRNRIYADEWKKDEHIIYTINESPYSNGGEIQFAVVADNKADIEFFCQDNNLPIRFGIQEDDTINQTM